MKKILLLLGVFIMLSINVSNVSAQLYEFDFNNLNQSKVREINYTRTTAFTDFALKIAHTGFEYLCQYRNQNSTIDLNGNKCSLEGINGQGGFGYNNVEPPLFENSSFTGKSVGGTDGTFTFLTPTTAGHKFYIITTDETHQIGEVPGGYRNLGFQTTGSFSSNGNLKMKKNTNYIQYYDGEWLDSSIRHSDDENTLVFFSIDTVNDISYISNFSDSFSVSYSDVNSDRFQILVEGGSHDSHDHRFDELFMINATPNYDEAANYIEWKKMSFDNASNKYRLWYQGSPSGVALNMSCDNGTTWTGTYSNYSDISCPNGQESHEVVIGATFNTTNANLTSIFLNGSLDIQLPDITMTLNDTSLSFADSVNITGNFTDNIGLDFCQITTNQSNSTEFFNFTLSGLSDECSQNFTISASTNAIVNFSIIVNDSSNNINRVTQLITIGDETPPFIQNINLSKTTLTTEQTLNLSFMCEDTDATVGQSFLDTMNFSIQLDGGITTLTRNIKFLAEGESGTGIRLDTLDYIWNYTLFETDETAQVGNWSVTAIACIDRAENYFVNDSVDLSFKMTEVPSEAPTGGGGGSITPPPKIIEKIIIEEKVCNYNGICEADIGEDFLNCPIGDGGDCRFEAQSLNPLCFFRPEPGVQCIYRFGTVSRGITILMILSLIIIAFLPQRNLDRIKRSFRKIKIERMKLKA